MLQSCWEYDPRQRPIVDDFVDLLRTNVSVIKPCIDAPLSAVALENNEEVSIPSKQSHQRLRLRTTSEHNQLQGLVMTSLSQDGRSGGSSGINIPSPTFGGAELFSLMPHHVGWSAKTGSDYPHSDNITASTPMVATSGGDRKSTSASDCLSSSGGGDGGEDDSDAVDTSCAVLPENTEMDHKINSVISTGENVLKLQEVRSHEGQLKYMALPTTSLEDLHENDFRGRHVKEVWHVNGSSTVGKHAVGNADVVLR